MKEHVIPLLLSIVATLLNYIFISTISAKQQQQTVADFKTVLDYLMQELKSGQQALNNRVDKVEANVLSQIKETGKPGGKKE